MKHHAEKVQQPEFAAAKDGYTFVSHQQEVGTGYSDKVTTIIQGGASSVTALTGFHRRIAVLIDARRCSLPACQMQGRISERAIRQVTWCRMRGKMPRPRNSPGLLKTILQGFDAQYGRFLK